MCTEHKHNQELTQEIRENNRKAPRDKWSKFKIIRKQLFIDDKKLPDPIIPLNLKIFSSNPEWTKKLDGISFIPSEPTISQGNYFWGYITTALKLTQVKQAYTCIYHTIPKSDHVMTANEVTLSDGKKLTGAAGDKEHGAGQAIHQVLDSKGLNNVAVFSEGGVEVSTWVLRVFKALSSVQLKQ